MTNLTHEQLVKDVHKVIWDWEGLRSGGPYALAERIIATIAEATKEPTEAMERAAEDTLGLHYHYGYETATDARNAIYKNMHAASPLYSEGE